MADENPPATPPAPAPDVELTPAERRALYESMTNADLAAELAERQLPKTGTKPELVDRLLADDDPDEPDPDICTECWPTGWPADSHSASCVHGEWLNQ